AVWEHLARGRGELQRQASLADAAAAAQGQQTIRLECLVQLCQLGVAADEASELQRQVVERLEAPPPRCERPLRRGSEVGNCLGSTQDAAYTSVSPRR